MLASLLGIDGIGIDVESSLFGVFLCAGTATVPSPHCCNSSADLQQFLNRPGHLPVLIYSDLYPTPARFERDASQHY